MARQWLVAFFGNWFIIGGWSQLWSTDSVLMAVRRFLVAIVGETPVPVVSSEEELKKED